MFTTLKPVESQRRSISLWGSLGLHFGLLAWLVYPSQPLLLTPSSVAPGENGHLLTRVYWPSRTPDDSDASSPDHAETYRKQRLAHQKLTLKQAKAAKLATPASPVPLTEAENSADTSTFAKLGHGAPAGLPYGSVPGGPVYGDEIRPALPAATADPVAYPWELPDSEGNVVVEITINEAGDIIRKTVLQSMGAALDGKVLAALENWRFHPATRNGIAIASRQDAIFHFRRRG